MRANDGLTVSVHDVEAPSTRAKAAQSLEDWTGVYEGLSDEEVDEVAKTVRIRTSLSRPLP